MNVMNQNRVVPYIRASFGENKDEDFKKKQRDKYREPISEAWNSGLSVLCLFIDSFEEKYAIDVLNELGAEPGDLLLLRLNPIY
jgi:hypothetical protein